MEKIHASPELNKDLEKEDLEKKLADLKYLPSREEIFKVFGHNKVSYEKWHEFVNNPEHRIYEFLNKEYLNDLGDYMAERIEELGGTTEKPLEILELGAGDGRLGHFLCLELEKRVRNKYKYITTDDSNNWIVGRPITRDDTDKHPGAHAITPTFPIDHNLDAEEAMKKFNPDIVIVSWMPSRTDFTEEIRKNKNVKEYVLIGWAYDNVCGDINKTWGVNLFQEDKIPQFEKEGFKDIQLEEVSKNQVGKNWGDYYTRKAHPSETVSFRKEK